MEIDIKAAYNDLENIKLLFNEYTTMLGVNLTFQGYDEEIKNLPGKKVCSPIWKTVHCIL